MKRVTFKSSFDLSGKVIKNAYFKSTAVFPKRIGTGGILSPEIKKLFGVKIMYEWTVESVEIYAGKAKESLNALQGQGWEIVSTHVCGNESTTARLVIVARKEMQQSSR